MSSVTFCGLETRGFNYYDGERIQTMRLTCIGQALRWLGVWYHETRLERYAKDIHAAALEGKLKEQTQLVLDSLWKAQERSKFGYKPFGDQSFSFRYDFQINEGTVSIKAIRLYSQSQSNIPTVSNPNRGFQEVIRSNQDTIVLHKIVSARIQGLIKHLRRPVQALANHLSIDTVHAYVPNPANLPTPGNVYPSRGSGAQKALFGNHTRMVRENWEYDTRSTRQPQFHYTSTLRKQPSVTFDKTLLFESMIQQAPTLTC